MADVHENISFVKGNHRNELAIVLDFVIGNYPKTLIQVKTQLPINHINKHTIKIHNH